MSMFSSVPFSFLPLSFGYFVDRIAEAWVDGSAGVMNLAGNRVFNVPAGTTVGGWRGYNASTGGTDYGGQDLTQEAFAGQGTYTLLAASTSITHQNP